MKITASTNTRTRIAELESRIYDLKDALDICTDEDERYCILEEITELEDELNHLWSEDEAEYDYAVEQQEFNPDGSLKYYSVDSSTSVGEYSELEEFSTRMYGDYYCACGCGRVLGRPTNGVDNLPTEWSYGVSKVDDDEGLEWRTFKSDDWELLKDQLSLEEIYNMFETNQPVE